ncbi:NADH dehydrogenase subunit 4 (mitochondrion) [Ornithodoros turicata]|uniref:NADH-ubiquinone oxidoreductase chain 4 n=1 Tax=Ornithodoros turicata TaxID=34597 RepID=A0A3G2JZX2_9ACAR|nr:NADH dehydrogenase subunit 4 [Ornithodoros turicata]AYN50593.1 NADH dehydrogenase subunit 4 [Ornithodoros turicata]UYB78699.1 NADH dehydrogenase subunit 4 [Ornithodoros turicata]
MLILVMVLIMMMCMYLYFSFVEFMFVLFFCCLFTFFLVDWSGIYLFVGELFGMDMLVFFLIELSLWIGMLMFLASMSLKVNFDKMFNFYIILMVLLLIFCFLLQNLIGFYLFFESVLFPIVMLIMGWGYQPERLQAGIYMLFYTLFGSLPLFLFFLFNSESLSIFYIYWMNYSLSMVMVLMGVLGFLVKMPMFFVHVWLPKAHVEAPVAGSMILAGVLLKLGIYGLLRIKFFLINNFNSFSFLIMSVVLIGGLMISLICLCQVDVKALIAYSSVCHMGMVLGGLMSMTGWGLIGSLAMMIGHGLCSSGLFCLANMYYERFYTRSMILLKGLGSVFPFLGLWWFLFSIINMAAPPSMNLGGELLLMGGIMKWSLMVMVPLGLMSFFSAGYSLYMFSYLNHGKGWVVYGVFMISIREMYLLFLHLIPLLLWILKMEMFMIWF